MIKDIGVATSPVQALLVRPHIMSHINYHFIMLSVNVYHRDLRILYI